MFQVITKSACIKISNILVVREYVELENDDK